MPQRRLAAALAPLAAVALFAGLAGCSSSEGTVSTTEGPTATANPTTGAHLDSAEFAAAIKIPDTVILDVRTPQEYEQGHLEGAINVDVNGDFETAMAQMDRGATYAVYCRSGSRSATAMQIMTDLGFTSRYDLSGGIIAWEDDGGKVVS